MRWTSHRHTPENLPVQAVDVRPAHERGRTPVNVVEPEAGRDVPGAASLAGQRHPRELAALRDEPARGVPDLDLLVEPAVADRSRPAPWRASQPGRGHGAHVPGQLDGRGPAAARRGSARRAAARPRRGRAVRVELVRRRSAGTRPRTSGRPLGRPSSQPIVARSKRMLDLVGEALARRGPRSVHSSIGGARGASSGPVGRRVGVERAGGDQGVHDGRSSWTSVTRATSAVRPVLRGSTSTSAGPDAGDAEEVRAGGDGVGVR